VPGASLSMEARGGRTLGRGGKRCWPTRGSPSPVVALELQLDPPLPQLDPCALPPDLCRGR
jgi:hypothetical protein